MIIGWVGNSDFYDGRYPQESDHFHMPITEDAVLRCAFSGENARRLSGIAAARCTFRFEQRKALQPTGLNPDWQSAPWVPGGVLKTPYSTLGRGVARFPKKLGHYGHIDVNDFYPEENLRCVVEEFIDGDQYEVDGLVVGGKIHFLPVLYQQWVGSHVWGYEEVVHRHTAKKLKNAAIAAVQAVGIDDCPFCVEIRLREEDRKPFVIEVHARFGEDFELAEAWGTDPIAWAEKIVDG